MNDDENDEFTIRSRPSNCANVRLSQNGWINSLFRYNSNTPYVFRYLREQKIFSTFLREKQITYRCIINRRICPHVSFEWQKCSKSSVCRFWPVLIRIKTITGRPRKALKYPLIIHTWDSSPLSAYLNIGKFTRSLWYDASHSARYSFKTVRSETNALIRFCCLIAFDFDFDFIASTAVFNRWKQSWRKPWWIRRASCFNCGLIFV